MSNEGFDPGSAIEPDGAGKSVWLAFGLTLLFGPLGLFYSTITGGIFMTAIVLVIVWVTWSFGFLLIWPICIAWGMLEAAKR